MFNLSLPIQVYSGRNCFADVGRILFDWGYKKVFIVTDPVMVALGYVQALQNDLATYDIASDIYADTVPEPTVASIAPAKDRVANCLVSSSQKDIPPYDAIIALGGGSVIDSAKAIAIWAKYGGHMADYKVPRVVNEQGLPLIAIPTTAGTGSETTKFTVITDESAHHHCKNEKMLCMGRGFLPTMAILDYKLTLSCPSRLTADSGIDALTHAVEAYVSAKATPFTDTLALRAMGVLFANLRTVYHNPHDEQAREQMMFGAFLAGMAFSNASVALVHGMSRPIGAFFHVPHGLSNAMLFPTVTQFSLSSAVERYGDVARACGMTDTLDNTKAGHILVNELIKLNSDLQVPTLEDFGADKTFFFANVDTMADQALASGSPANNPKIPSKEEIIELYHDLWS